jgi:DNA repair protein RadD
MALTARYYQTDAVYAIWNYFTDHTGNPVVAMPTGTGKSVVIGMFLESAFRAWPNQRIMVLTHVKELIGQNYEKLMTLWPTAPAGIYSAGLKRREAYMPITFAGIGSVAKKPHLFGKVDLVLIDEAHLVSPDQETMYRAFLQDLKQANPYLKVVGFTATPWRLGHGRITEDGIFTDIAYDITTMEAFNRLIAEGFLCPLIPKHTSACLDVDGVHLRGGEFNQTELQLAVDKEEVTYRALVETMEYGADRKHWLIFASGVEHAENIASMLNGLGIPTVAIHSKMSDAARDQAILDFKAGKYRAAVNNNVLTTGFDFPAIDLIVVLRPTMSAVLWVQMLGRGTRPWTYFCQESGTQFVKENCLVLDFARNTKRLGPINDPVVPRKKGKGGGEAPVKLCMSCCTYNHASVSHCHHCGAEFQFAVKITTEASTDDLIIGDAPIVEVFKVDHITYSKHTKIGSQPSLKVSYYSNLKVFHEYVALEHSLGGGRRARAWWAARALLGDVPETVDAALEQVGTLQAATHLRVWTNKKYPEVLAHCFDGSSFGTQDADASNNPTIDAKIVKHRPHEERMDSDAVPEFAATDSASYFDDDIPF